MPLGMGMSQRPLPFHLPVIMMVLFLMILTLYWVKIAMQSSSHNCAIDTSDPVLSLSKINACFAFLDNAGDKGTSACHLA